VRWLSVLTLLLTLSIGCEQWQTDDDTTPADDDDTGDDDTGDDDTGDDDTGDDDTADDDSADDDSADDDDAGPPERRLLSLHQGTQEILEIDYLSGAVSVLGTINTGNNINTAVFGPDGQIWASDSTDDTLISVDPCTGIITVIGSTGTGDICGMTFDSLGDLYGMNATSDELVQIDRLSGATTVVGSLGIQLGSCGLCYDLDGDRLLGLNKATDEVFTVDTTTGAATTLSQASVPFQNVGAEYDPVDHLLLASSGSELYHVDPDTGDTTYIGPMTGYSGVDDLALFWGDWPCD